MESQKSDPPVCFHSFSSSSFSSSVHLQAHLVKHHPVLLGSKQLTAVSEEGSELAMRWTLEKELREEGMVDYDQLTLEDGGMNNHPP